nr:hypothetical protein [Nannocystis sp.]
MGVEELVVGIRDRAKVIRLVDDDPTALPDHRIRHRRVDHRVFEEHQLRVLAVAAGLQRQALRQRLHSLAAERADCIDVGHEGTQLVRRARRPQVTGSAPFNLDAAQTPCRIKRYRSSMIR